MQKSFPGRNRRDVTEMIERLIEIEHQITKPERDGQIVALEFRGKKLEQALAVLNSTEEEVQSLYSGLQFFISPPKARFSGYGLGLIYGMIPIKATHDLLSAGSVHESLVDGALLAVALMLAQDWIHFQQQRWDWGYEGLKKALDRLARGTSDNSEIYFSGGDIQVPVEFHQMLMGQFDDPEAARAAALETWGRPFFTLRRPLPRTGEFVRSLFVDHIVYVDDATGDPVWLFVYRAFRERPMGRHSREVANGKLDPTWGLLPQSAPTPGQ